MSIKATILFLILMMIPSSTFSAASPSYKSKYAGEEKREIKSLSEADIEELKNGEGWGLAKAAELNGVPGPAHLLEMKDEINLSTEQVRVIEDLYQKMKQAAIPLGLELIGLERELNNHFADRTITDELLDKLLDKIAQVRKKLRYVHLSTHLKTPSILTPEQMPYTTRCEGTHQRTPVKISLKGMIPKCGKGIIIVHS